MSELHDYVGVIAVIRIKEYTSAINVTFPILAGSICVG